MTPHDVLDNGMPRWLAEQAAHRVPGHLDEVLRITATTRQRPWWSSPERWLPVDLTLRRTPLFLGTPRRAVVALATLGLLVLALVAVLSGSGAKRLPAPFGIAGNGSILVDTSSVSNGDILVADADGSNLRTLVGGDTNDYGPSYSRDGSRLMFLRRTGPGLVQPMLANADGSAVRPLTNQSLQGLDWYEWSPTGDRVVLVHTVGDDRVLSIVQTDQPSSLRDLPLPEGLFVDTAVLWRPVDGDELIFRTTERAGLDGTAGLAAIRPDGTGFRWLSEGKGGSPPYDMIEASPDGRAIAYWQYDVDDSPNGATANVHLLDLDTLVDRIVRFGPDETVDEAELRFAPAGNRAVIVGCPAGVCQLAVVTLDGSAPPKFLGPPLPGPQMSRVHGWSPDGQQIVLHLDGDKPMFIDPDTGAVTTGEARFDVLAGWQRRTMP